jgi:hypothetical protein
VPDTAAQVHFYFPSTSGLAHSASHWETHIVEMPGHVCRQLYEISRILLTTPPSAAGDGDL